MSEYRFRDDPEILDKPVRGSREKQSADTALARYAVAEALAPHRRALRRKGSLALVVEVPSAAWVHPVVAACRDELDFAKVFDRTGESRLEHRPDKGNADAAEILARGQRVLGVAPSPRLHLPASLVSAADVNVRMGEPSAAVIEKVIRAATGRSVVVPEGIVAGLDFNEIAASIRIGDKPERSLARLSAAQSGRAGNAAIAHAAPFEALRGYGEAHVFGMALIDAVRAYRGGADLRTLGGRACVLASEPGLGKTTMVRSLARSAGLDLVETSVSEWFTSGAGYLDSVLKAIDAVFARANRDCLIMFDECEAIPSRATLDSRNREWWTTVVAHLLLKVEKTLARTDAFVAMVGATNHPEKLDAALVRPGRLDRIIRIGFPDVDDLAAIIRQHLGSDLPGEDLFPLAHLAIGATGARAAMIVREARGRATATGRPLTMDDLVAVVAPIGPTDPAFTRRACLHEAGHAVISERLAPGRLKAVSVVGGDRVGGSTVRDAKGAILPLRRDVEDDVLALLAGRAAEIAFLGEASSGAGGGDDSDLGRATLLVARMHGSLGLGGRLTYRGKDDALLESLRYDRDFARDVEATLTLLMTGASALVESDRVAIDLVATVLAERRALSGVEIRAILAG